MKWFKFYGQDFLTDPKIKALSVEMRQCWVVLLCMTNGEDKAGRLKYVDELEVMRLAGIEEDGQTWHETRGFLELFRDMEMITIDNVSNGLSDITLTNYQKRQGEAMTAYERVKKYRENKKSQKTNDNGATLSKRNNSLQNVTKNEAIDNADNKNDNARVDKIREDKNKEIIKKEDLSSFLFLFNSLFGTKYQETNGRKDKLNARLKTYTLEQILQATRNLYASPFHRGKNDRNWIANPDFLIKSDEKVDEWLNKTQPQKQSIATPSMPKVVTEALSQAPQTPEEKARIEKIKEMTRKTLNFGMQRGN